MIADCFFFIIYKLLSFISMLVIVNGFFQPISLLLDKMMTCFTGMFVFYFVLVLLEVNSPRI